jgi:carboxymethylenebutenolidase
MNTSRHEGTRVGRRQFLRCAAGAGAAFGLIDLLQMGGTPHAASAAAKKSPPPPPPGYPPLKQDESGITVPPDDPGISAGPAQYPGTITPLMGYLSAPRGGEVYPGILVLHDIGGLTEHFRDITRRLAKSGYVALAPDLLSRQGGTAKVGDAAAIQDTLIDISPAQYLADINSAVGYLEAQPLAAKTRIGNLGFGLGGSLSWLILTQNPDIKAAVMISGPIPSSRVVERLKAPILAIFGAAEQQNQSELTNLDAQMKKAGITWLYKLEPKANRGFFDDTQKRFDPDAAKDAWKMTLDWFAGHLGS